MVGKTGKDKFHAILGGTHLDFLTPEQLEETIQVLKKMDIRTNRSISLHRDESRLQTYIKNLAADSSMDVLEVNWKFKKEEL